LKERNKTIFERSRGLLDKIKGLKNKEETDIDYKRERDTLISSSLRRTFKLSIYNSKFNIWSLLERSLSS
jgi:hypothetical protein